AYDRYLAERPSPHVPYGQFVASDLPLIRLMADSPKDDCALHEVSMAFELLEFPATWSTPEPLVEGVYLIHAFKSSHRGDFIAMQHKGDRMFVRENGATTGIMSHDWMRNIGFVRRFSFRG
ncbi:hypothetical protein PybrP1_010221, partial [[Pythium] brassicae (nom. inval.)]